MMADKKQRSSSGSTGKRVSYSRVESMASESDSIKEAIGTEDVEAFGKEEEELDEQIEDSKIGRQVVLAIIIICLLLLLGMVDSMTTKYCKRGSMAFALWTVRNAPWAFLVYMFVIIVLIICCLPYGPLSMLMGAVFVEIYGYTYGITLGVICLFATTMAAGVICFSMARDHFQQFVLKKLSKSESLKTLRNLDRLIQDGQGFEMVLLVRLAPLPTGPTYYFLGTTSVTWDDFLAGNSVTNAIFAVTDILIGAGAKSMSTDNPVGIAIFVVCLAGFFLLICYVGLRAKRKLEALDRADEELAHRAEHEAKEDARRAEKAEADLVRQRFTKDGRLIHHPPNSGKKRGGGQIASSSSSSSSSSAAHNASAPPPGYAPFSPIAEGRESGSDLDGSFSFPTTASDARASGARNDAATPSSLSSSSSSAEQQQSDDVATLAAAARAERAAAARGDGAMDSKAAKARAREAKKIQVKEAKQQKQQAKAASNHDKRETSRTSFLNFSMRRRAGSEDANTTLEKLAAQDKKPPQQRRQQEVSYDGEGGALSGSDSDSAFLFPQSYRAQTSSSDSEV